MKGLRLTARGELVRDVVVAIIAAPVAYGFIIAMIAGLESAASL